MLTKRAALYTRISTLSCHNPNLQPHELRQTASEMGYRVVREYADRAGGNKAKRPALDQLLADARGRKFDVVMVGSLSDVAPSVKQCLSVLDQLKQVGIGFISCHPEIDTTGSSVRQ